MSAPSSVLDVQAADLLAFRTRLVRHQLHAQNVAGTRLDVLQRLGHLHAAALAAATRVNLRLHDPHRAAQLLGGRHRLINRERRYASRHRHVELAQNFLALVFVDLHRGDLLDLSGC
jgi:hypothetical protein